MLRAEGTSLRQGVSEADFTNSQRHAKRRERRIAGGSAPSFDFAATQDAVGFGAICLTGNDLGLGEKIFRR